MMRELKPISIRISEWDLIEKKIKDLFKKLLYEPLLKELSLPSTHLIKKNEFSSTSSPLHEALQKGTVTFYRGQFSGLFTAEISKELRSYGARWNRQEKTYLLNLVEMPAPLKQSIASSEFAFQKMAEKVDRKLAEIVPEELSKHLKIADLFDRTIWKVHDQMKENVKNLTVTPTLTPYQSKKIADEWQNNMDLWIQTFTKEQIQALRSEVRASAFQGNRYGSLIQSIQDSFNVTQKKAKFLARQETNLLLTTYQYAQYQEMGIRYYKWRCVKGTALHPVRPRHQELNDMSQKENKLFRFDRPPVTSEPGQAQRRNNPGQDYACRCVSTPILPEELIHYKKKKKERAK